VSFFAELKRRNVFRVGAAYAVVAWLLIQIAETIFPLFGFDETPARIVVIVLAIGFLPAMVFAWAFELTPEGLRRERDIDRTRSITPQTGRRLDRLILLVMAVALAWFAFERFVMVPHRASLREAEQQAELEEARRAGRSEALVESYGDKSIAVLAFEDMSPQREQEYLSDGIAEELLNLLAQLPELRVISRSSAFSFKDQRLSVPEIARHLNVSHVLEGSVRQSGDRVRITAQLIEAGSDRHLWSQTFDRNLDDIFAIQDEIAGEVVQQLRVKLLGEPLATEEIDSAAYTLFLQARHLSNQYSRDGMMQARVLFEQALAIEPDYAPAWNGLSVNFYRMAAPGLISESESRVLAREAVDRALAIDADYAAAYAHSAWLRLFHENDPAAAARDMSRALDLSSADPWIIGRAAGLLFNIGRLDEAIELGAYELERDPLFVPGHWNQGLRMLAARRWDDAIEEFETVLRLNPMSQDTWFGIADALLFKGDPEGAYEAATKILSEPDRLFRLALTCHALGRNSEADQALAELIEKYGDIWPTSIAGVHAFRGEADRAFEWLAAAVERGDSGLHESVFLRPLQDLGDDPRWLPFLESIGKSPAQLAAIELDVRLPR